MITIGLLAVLWRRDARPWMHWLGVAALALVIFQGVLGGLRVLLDERTLAMLHGCTGPLFFALTVAMAIFTSRRWSDTTGSAGVSAASSVGVQRLAIVTAVLVYLQIVLGAVVRHVPIDSEPATFALAVRFHLFLAAILSLHIIALVWSVFRSARQIRPLSGLAGLLIGLLTLQLALGAGTWVVKFAAPAWVPQWASLGPLAVEEGGLLQTHVITAHVAIGSLLLVTTLALALYALRLLAREVPAHTMPVGKLEAAV
jgi:cytochrome c oxidase assembly protein subunit 15